MTKYLATGLSAFMALLIVTASSAAPSTDRQDELTNLVKHDCGSCHGLTMKGGLGSPLLPDQLRNRPDEDLVAIILEGLTDTPMPPWEGQLSEEEAAWIVRLLKEGVPQ